MWGVTAGKWLWQQAPTSSLGRVGHKLVGAVQGTWPRTHPLPQFSCDFQCNYRNQTGMGQCRKCSVLPYFSKSHVQCTFVIYLNTFPPLQKGSSACYIVFAGALSGECSEDSLDLSEGVACCVAAPLLFLSSKFNAGPSNAIFVSHWHMNVSRPTQKPTQEQEPQLAQDTSRYRENSGEIPPIGADSSVEPSILGTTEEK